MEYNVETVSDRSIVIQTLLGKVDAFILSPFNREWLEVDSIVIYCRKAKHLHPTTKKLVSCLDIANINILSTGEGTFTQLLHDIEAVARRHNFEALYIENVLTDRFAQFFRNQCVWIETSHAIPNFMRLLT